MNDLMQIEFAVGRMHDAMDEIDELRFWHRLFMTRLFRAKLHTYGMTIGEARSAFNRLQLPPAGNVMDFFAKHISRSMMHYNRLSGTAHFKGLAHV